MEATSVVADAQAGETERLSRTHRAEELKSSLAPDHGFKTRTQGSGIHHYRKKHMSTDLKLAVGMLLLIRMLPLCLFRTKQVTSK